jgi:hypothetical protein
MLVTTSISSAPSGRLETDLVDSVFDADAAIEAVGDELNVQGFDVGTYTSLECGYLKITSIWATVADLTIFRNGTVDFDYHCFDGNPHDPGEMMAIILAILHDHDRGGEAARYPHMSFLFSIARAALEQSLSVELDSIDPANAFWRITDEVSVTNSDRPERGTIRVTDDGALWWRCQLRGQPPDKVGLGLTEITSSTVRAIGSAQVAKCEEMSVRAVSSASLRQTDH